MKTLLTILLLITAGLNAQELPKELEHFQKSRVEVYGKIGMIPPPLDPIMVEYVRMMAKQGKIKQHFVGLDKKPRITTKTIPVHLMPLDTQAYDVYQIFED